MKILFLTPHLPSPPAWGVTRRLHGLISGLARTHEVSVVSFVTPGSDQAAAVRATRDYCAEVVTVENDRYGLNHAQKRALQLRSLTSPSSFERLMHHRPAMQVALDRLARHTSYDLINVEFCHLAGYRFPAGVPVNLGEHNIEYDILYRTWTAEAAPNRKIYNYVNFLKLRREERAAWRQVDGCTLTSARDERLLRRDVPTVPTAVVPNGVDTAYFRPGRATPDPLTLVFVGVGYYYPNTDGLLFFLRDVMPLLRRHYPRVRLLVVGAPPPDEVVQQAGEGVTFTGGVDDVRPYVEQAGAIIVPLRIGGGTRLKVVEAQAMGKAIVSTTIGAEGIEVTDGRDILLADTAEHFAAQVGRVIDDRALAGRLGEAARRLAERRYDWRVAVHQLETFYHDLLSSAGAPGRRHDRVVELGPSLASGTRPAAGPG